MTQRTLTDYMMGIKKTHEYRVRIAQDVLTKENMNRIENNLKKYELIDITSPKRTIFQKQALGFTEPTKSEVWIFDIKTGLPASHFWIGREIAQILKISEIFVVVNCAENPLPEPGAELEKKEYKSVVSTDPAYPEQESLPKAEELFGDKYNETMLRTILDARKKNPSSIVKSAKN